MRRPFVEDAPPVHENFVHAIATGRPPNGGRSIGSDRVVMLLTCETSIRDGLLFPTKRTQD